jgi:hypothetical protein
MPRLLVILVPLLFIFAFAACNGDDGDGGGAASPTLESTSTLEPTQTLEASPEPAIAVSRLDNAAEFLQQFADKELTKEACTFDASAGRVDCAENGLYEPDTLPGDADLVCDIVLADGEPIAVTCETSLSVAYYEIAP